MDRSRAKERTTIRLPPMVTILMTAAATLRTTIQTVLRQSYDSRTKVQTTAPRQSYHDPDGRATVVRQSYNSRTTVQTTAPRQSYHDPDGRATIVLRPPPPKRPHSDSRTTIKKVVRQLYHDPKDCTQTVIRRSRQSYQGRNSLWSSDLGPGLAKMVFVASLLVYHSVA